MEIILTPEFLSFAEYFSDNYRNLSTGNYISDNQKYHIRYLNQIKDIHGNIVRLARVGITTRVIELSKYDLSSEKITSDFVFYFIIWCAIESKELNVKLTDRIALDYYLKTECSKSNLIAGFEYLFELAPSELNTQRLETIKNIINK